MTSAWLQLIVASLFEIAMAVGIAWFGESASVVRLAFIGLIVAGTVGLQLTSV